MQRALVGVDAHIDTGTTLCTVGGDVYGTPFAEINTVDAHINTGINYTLA